MSNQQSSDAPQTTYDAALWELRTYGSVQLGSEDCRRRISDLSIKQLRELIAALMRLRSQYSMINDELLLKLGDLL
jgi:hypothetical protein